MVRHEERDFELLQRRLALLEELAAALRASTEALVRLDIEAIHRTVGDQERLCAEIGSLDRELKAWGRRRAAGGELGELVVRVARAQGEVRQLNERHAALVRRSRRTVDAMMNFLRSTAPTYANPRLASNPAGGRI